MSIRMALAKMSAVAAGGALVAGGAVHVAETQTGASYRAVKGEKVQPLRYVKEQPAQRAAPRTERRVQQVIERDCPEPFVLSEGPDGPICVEEQQFAMLPVPLPQLPPQGAMVSGGGGQPVILGSSGGWGGGFGGGFFGGFFGGGGLSGFPCVGGHNG